MTPELIVGFAALGLLAVVFIVLANISAKLGTLERAQRNAHDDIRALGGDVRQQVGHLTVLSDVHRELAARAFLPPGNEHTPARKGLGN